MKNIRDFLSLSSSERKGVLVLLVIIIILVIIRLYQAEHLYSADEVVPVVENYDIGTAVSDTNADQVPEEFIQIDETPILKAPLFAFDPNRVDEAGMKRLGFTQRQIRNILRYRSHGGVFRKKEDLLKIYTLNSDLYNRLSPYILIADEDSIRQLVSKKNVMNNVPADLNTADSVSLMKIYGIGPVLSRRIIRYRLLLGGYYSTGQLKEVYGLQDSVLRQLESRYYADTNQIRKININIASEAEMARHPYIGKSVARGIILYREKIRRFSAVAELKNQKILTGEAFERAKKYLVI